MKTDDTSLQACLKDTKAWITCNFPLLNSDKTELFSCLSQKSVCLTRYFISVATAQISEARLIRYITDSFQFHFFLTRMCNSTLILIRSLGFDLGRHFFICVILPKLETSSLRLMLQNYSLYALLGWTAVIPYHLDVLKATVLLSAHWEHQGIPAVLRILACHDF